MDAVLAVAADYANISSDGKVNIMGIFQEITPVQFPATVQQMFLVISWSAAPAEFDSQKGVRIAFMDPDNDQNLVLEYDIVVPSAVRSGAPSIFHQILGIGGLPVFKPGPHGIYILVGDDTKATVPLYVNEPRAPGREEVSSSG